MQEIKRKYIVHSYNIFIILKKFIFLFIILYTGTQTDYIFDIYLFNIKSLLTSRCYITYFSKPSCERICWYYFAHTAQVSRFEDKVISWSWIVYGVGRHKLTGTH